MSEGLNRVLLIGNLGQDPELRHTQGGQAILNLRIATNESYLNRDGERQEKTEWHTVIIWGKRGEALSKFLTKGKQIFVEGRLQTRFWEDKQGAKRYSTEVVATDIILLGGASRGGGQRTSYDDAPAPTGDEGASRSSVGETRTDDDDIPF